jgi:hypothetical protein
VSSDRTISRTADFDLRALYDALDEERRARQLTWQALAAEVNQHRTALHPISPSTITSLETKADAEGDGVLQLLVWLRRTPESFVPGAVDPQSPRFTQPDLQSGQILRWDALALYTALDAERRERSLTWAELAREMDGFTPSMLQNLDKGGRVGFPRVMRLVRFLGRPAASFTRVASQ